MRRVVYIIGGSQHKISGLIGGIFFDSVRFDIAAGGVAGEMHIGSAIFDNPAGNIKRSIVLMGESRGFRDEIACYANLRTCFYREIHRQSFLDDRIGNIQHRTEFHQEEMVDLFIPAPVGVVFRNGDDARDVDIAGIAGRAELLERVRRHSAGEFQIIRR